MTQTLGCEYSTISPSELMANVIPEYCIESPVECVFWERGASDTYQVRCANDYYYLRVYRSDAYPREANEFEAEALAYLQQQGFSVAYPIPRKSGKFITEIIAPEGPRNVLITAVAQGRVPDFDSHENCRLIGRSVANLHQLSTGFKTCYQRSDLDLHSLLDSSMVLIRDHFAHHSNASKFIDKIAQEARFSVEAVPNELLDYGICHGDLHGGNLHIHEGVVTHFDFEECAYGFRLYDLATFKWDICTGKDEIRRKRWNPFIEGYLSVKSISEPALALVNTFVIIRELAETAYGIRHVQDFGHNAIMASDIDRVCERLTFLRELTE